MKGPKQLLRWYGRHKRDLPWRRKRDGYAIWVSEIMLQQTRVETVIPYFEAFLKAFPTVEDLASRPLDEILAHWSGLGYYRRARFLHQAARQVVEGGQGLPTTFDGWRKLPGVGDYTAAAVSSIAFGVAEPVLDGNVERVLARRFAVAGDLRTASARREMRQMARGFVDLEQPGDSNQAMMELGATVCLPAKPRCEECPLEGDCEARRQGRIAEFPHKRGRKPPERRQLVAAVASRGDRVLVFRRDDRRKLLAGTWEFPWVDVTGRSELTAGQLADLFAGAYGSRWRVGEVQGTLAHAITYRRLEVTVYAAEVEAANEPGQSAGVVREGPEQTWLTAQELAGKATSSLVGKVLEAHRATSDDQGSSR